MAKTYNEMCRYETFRDRYKYLRLGGSVGKDTFGFDRYLNQEFYHSDEWSSIRDKVIIRDEGRDLGVPGYEINGRIYIHHIDPITKLDLLERSDKLFDLNNLVCCSYQTHQAIHYGDESLLYVLPPERTKNDTCPWKN